MNEFLYKIVDEKQKLVLTDLFNKILIDYPFLKCEIKWNQPMFIMDKTFIIGFSCSKHHISISPEAIVIDLLNDEIIKNNYEMTKNIIKVKNDQEMNYDFIKMIIDFNVKDKVDCQTFFRK